MYQYLKRPKVSICIPAYENPEGITRLLDSILTKLFTLLFGTNQLIKVLL